MMSPVPNESPEEHGKHRAAAPVDSGEPTARPARHRDDDSVEPDETGKGTESGRLKRWFSRS